MNLILACNILYFAFLGSIWTRDTMLNFSIKFLAWMLAVTNLFFVLKLSGYIVQVP